LIDILLGDFGLDDFFTFLRHRRILQSFQLLLAFLESPECSGIEGGLAGRWGRSRILISIIKFFFLIFYLSNLLNIFDRLFKLFDIWDVKGSILFRLGCFSLDVYSESLA